MGPLNELRQKRAAAEAARLQAIQERAGLDSEALTRAAAAVRQSSEASAWCVLTTVDGRLSPTAGAAIARIAAATVHAHLRLHGKQLVERFRARAGAGLHGMLSTMPDGGVSFALLSDNGPARAQFPTRAHLMSRPTLEHREASTRARARTIAHPLQPAA